MLFLDQSFLRNMVGFSFFDDSLKAAILGKVSRLPKIANLSFSDVPIEFLKEYVCRLYVPVAIGLAVNFFQSFEQPKDNLEVHVHVSFLPPFFFDELLKITTLNKID